MFIILGKCTCCRRVRWIYKNKNDLGYNQKACWKCYSNSIKEAQINRQKEKELSEYRDNLKKKISEHFANSYCAKTELGSVMYEKEIMELIDKQ